VQEAIEILCSLLVFIAIISVLHLLHRRFPTRLTAQQQNTALGPFSFVITLYAFLLGFIVVSLWQTFRQADRAAANEAETIVAIYRLTESFSETQSVRQTLSHYTSSITHEEWPAMAIGETSPATEALYHQVWQELRTLNPETQKELAIYGELLNELGNLTHYRGDRLLLVDGSIPSLMWWALVFGGLMVLVGLYYLGIGSPRYQFMVNVTVIGMLMITVYLAIELNKPFQGYLKVTPRAFEFIAVKMAESPPR
jgi:hypothetical protein